MNLDRRAVSAPTLEIAGWIARLRHADLPPRTRAVVRCAILDTVGCGVYGYHTPWAKMLLAWARAGVAMLAALNAAGAAPAQQGAYPSKPIRLLVPFPLGGGTDLMARIVGRARAWSRWAARPGIF